jgi:hypothetical protein
MFGTRKRSECDVSAKVKSDPLAEVAARYAVAITPAMETLIDSSDAADPIAAQFRPDARELEIAADELTDPIGDGAHTPVKGVVHRYRDRCLLKLVHVCPVYCRFCFRREMVGPPASGNARDGSLTSAELEAGDWVHRGAPPDLGGHPHRRRSVPDLCAARARDHGTACRNCACEDRSLAYACACGRSAAGYARFGRSAARYGRHNLCRAAHQPPTRADRARARGHRAHRRRRRADAVADGAAKGRKRRCRYAGGADARLGRGARQAILPASLGQGARHVALPMLDRGRSKARACAV